MDNQDSSIKNASENDLLNIVADAEAGGETLGPELFNDLDLDVDQNQEQDQEHDQEQDQEHDQEQDQEQDNENISDNGNLSGFLSPELILPIFDVVVSRAATLLTAKFTSYKCEIKDFKLDASEKAALKRPLKRYLESLDIREQTPSTELIICLLMIYGTKFALIMGTNKEVISNAKPEAKQRKGRRSYMKDSSGKIIEPKRYADTGELV